MAGEQLPSHMFLDYKQYKRDSEAVAQWLAENSAKAGYKPTTDQSFSPAEAKLKGRARKLARDAAKAQGIKNTRKDRYLVKTSEFTKMAKAIVTRTPRTVLSRSMQFVWRRAIEKRRMFIDWSAKHADGHATDDDGHIHFANILDQTLDMLQPCWESGATTTDQQHAADEASHGTTNHAKSRVEPEIEVKTENMFDRLTMEDLADDDTAQDFTQPQQVDVTLEKSLARIELSESEQESEFFFAIWAFMMQVFDVRIYIKSVWILYSRDEIDLMQAATVSNLAIDLIRHAEADFGETIKRPSKYPRDRYPSGCLPSLLFYKHLPNGNEKLRCFDPHAANDVIMCGCPLVDVLLHVSCTVAGIFVHTIREIPISFPTKENNYKFATPSIFVGRPKEVGVFDAAYQAKRDFADSIPNLVTTSMLLGGPVQDESLHAIRHLYENFAVPIWVAAALQLEFDIRKVCSDDKAWLDLKGAYNSMLVKHDQHRAWLTKIGHPTWGQKSGAAFESLMAISEMLVTKICDLEFQALAAASEPRNGVLETMPLPASATKSIKALPLACGTFKQCIYTTWHCHGTELANATGSLQLLCQLYTAVRIANTTFEPWPDLHLVIRFQGNQSMLQRCQLTRIADVEKTIWNSNGLSLERWKSGRSHRVPSLRRFLQVSPMMVNIYSRFHETDARKVEGYAAQLRSMVLSDAFNCRAEWLAFVTPSPISSVPTTINANKVSQTGMVDILKRFYAGFQAEMPALTMDNLQLTRSAISVFRNINTAMHTKPYPYPEVDMVQDSRGVHDSLSNTIRMLRNAVFCEEQLSNQQIARVSTEVSLSWSERMRAIVSPATDAIRAFLAQSSGDLSLRELKQMCGDRNYGARLFCPSTLENLYGLDRQNQWVKPIVFDERAEKVNMCDPGSAFNISIARHIHCIHNLPHGMDKAISMRKAAIDFDDPLFRDLKNAVVPDAEQKKDSKKPSNPVEKEEWEHYGDIFGRGGSIWGCLQDL